MSDANRPRTIVDGVLQKVSVSQIKTFGHLPEEPTQSSEGCPRKWHFEKVMGLKPPQTKALEVGTKVHAEIEHYLKTGEDVLGDIARAGKEFMPTPGKDLLVEYEFKSMVAGVEFGGFIDLVNPREVKKGVLKITDWKTAGRLHSPWSTKASDLQTVMTGHGTQMQGYAMALAPHFPTVTRFELEHVTMQTKGPREAKRLVAPADLIGLRKEWKTVERRVERMKVYASEENPARVPANTKACKAFGGCPYLKQCGQKDVARVLAFGFESEGKGMSLIKKFVKPEAAVIPPPPAATAKPAPSQAKPIQKDSEKPAPRLPIIDESTDDGETYEVAGLGEITPTGDVSAEGNPIVTTQAGERLEMAALPAPKRGRPSKKAVEAAQQVAAVEAITAPNQFAAPGPMPIGVTLYIDCVPSTPSKPLDEYIATLCKQICEATDSLDIRASEHDSLKFGKWKGSLAMLVRESPPAPGEYVVFSGDLADIVIEALSPLAVRTVRKAGR